MYLIHFHTLSQYRVVEVKPDLRDLHAFLDWCFLKRLMKPRYIVAPWRITNELWMAKVGKMISS